jgi:acetyltransferase-like isoleucine patch superfamily enzyme
VCSKAKSHGKVKVRRYSTVNRGTVLGDQVSLGGIHIVGKGNCYVGNYVHTGTDCQILTDYHNYDGGELIPYDHSWVVNDIPPMAIAGGHPAKVFKYRNVEHFQKLKREGKFLMLD